MHPTGKRGELKIKHGSYEGEGLLSGGGYNS